jgi:hypothetical protein
MPWLRSVTPGAECAFEVVVLGEAPQHDVDGALQL